MSPLQIDANQSYSEINELLTVPDVQSPASGGRPPLLSLLQVFWVEKLLTLNQRYVARAHFEWERSDGVEIMY